MYLVAAIVNSLTENLTTGITLSCRQELPILVLVWATNMTIQVKWALTLACTHFTGPGTPERIFTAKWIWDSFIFSSIKPKHDKRLFVYFCFFPILTWIYVFCAKFFSEHQSKTFFWAKQVNLGKNGEKIQK